MTYLERFRINSTLRALHESRRRLDETAVRNDLPAVRGLCTGSLDLAIRELEGVLVMHGDPEALEEQRIANTAWDDRHDTGPFDE